MRTLLSRRVDGTIVTGRRIDPRRRWPPACPCRWVYVMTQSENPGGQPTRGLHRQPGRLVIRESSRP